MRQRNGQWEAKVRKGGTFNDSKFEELFDPHEISQYVKNLTGIGKTEEDHFGLERIAMLSTLRKAWMADHEFKIVSDTTDFGHTVGEVELQKKVDFIGAEDVSIEQQKQRVMQEMDERIVKFMSRYAWAFRPGIPTGKLSAYFKRETT